MFGSLRSCCGVKLWVFALESDLACDDFFSFGDDFFLRASWLGRSNDFTQ